MHKIVNGELAEFGRYPYMAALLLDNALQNFVCGGTLIAPKVVLTAAHCLETTIPRVALGCTDITDLAPSKGCEIIDVSKVIIHPDFDFNLNVRGGNDIGIIILAEDSVQDPVQIAAPGFSFSDEEVMEVGWGNELPVTFAFRGGTQLREARAHLISNEECDLVHDFLFGTIRYGIDDVDTIDNTMICAIGDSKGVCQGDSGGPLLIACDETGKDLQIGVTSFGMGCAMDGIPAVFSRTFTDAAIKFIVTQVAALGQMFQFRTDLEGFCSQLPEPPAPTPFPTYNGAWTCSPGAFSGRDGCHCNCGLPDPDCEYDTLVFIGCEEGEICNSEGECVEGEAFFPGIPEGWTCNPRHFNSNDGCDCNCGVLDPDCISDTVEFAKNCNSTEICNAQGVCEEAPPKDIPEEWTCLPLFFNNSDGCDCNCGVLDPDCLEDSEFFLFGCQQGFEVCNSEGLCVRNNGTFAPTTVDEAPPEWTCAPELFNNNDGCHCECGIFDPDCFFEPSNLVNCPGASSSDKVEFCNAQALCAEANITVDATPPNESDSFFDDGAKVAAVFGSIGALLIVIVIISAIVQRKRTQNRTIS